MILVITMAFMDQDVTPALMNTNLNSKVQSRILSGIVNFPSVRPVRPVDVVGIVRRVGFPAPDPLDVAVRMGQPFRGRMSGRCHPAAKRTRQRVMLHP